MQTAPTVIFRKFRGDDALEADVRARLAKLERYYPSIVGATVVVELAARRHQGGNRFRVRIELSVPGGTIVVKPDPSLRPVLRAAEVQATRKQHETDPGRRYAKVAVREAFEAARRRLQDYARKQRGDVKNHAKGGLRRTA
jgi:hypothetical protein